MSTRDFERFTLYFLLIFIIIEPPIIVSASKYDLDYKKTIVSGAYWVNASDSPFLPEFNKEEHTHQEDQSPQQYKDMLDYSLGTAGTSQIQKSMSYVIKQ